MSKYQKGVIQVLKNASGYHYKNLHVTVIGSVLNADYIAETDIINELNEVVHVRAHYLLHCTREFVLRTTLHSTILRKDLSKYALLQISTADGELFYILVSRRRLGPISRKAKCFRDLEWIV